VNTVGVWRNWAFIIIAQVQAAFEGAQKLQGNIVHMYTPGKKACENALGELFELGF
jgi:hypothetical protein